MLRWDVLVGPSPTEIDGEGLLFELCWCNLLELPPFAVCPIVSLLCQYKSNQINILLGFFWGEGWAFTPPPPPPTRTIHMHNVHVHTHTYINGKAYRLNQMFRSF